MHCRFMTPGRHGFSSLVRSNHLGLGLSRSMTLGPEKQILTMALPAICFWCSLERMQDFNVESCSQSLPPRCSQSASQLAEHRRGCEESVLAAGRQDVCPPPEAGLISWLTGDKSVRIWPYMQIEA